MLTARTGQVVMDINLFYFLYPDLFSCLQSFTMEGSSFYSLWPLDLFLFCFYKADLSWSCFYFYIILPSCSCSQKSVISMIWWLEFYSFSYGEWLSFSHRPRELFVKPKFGAHCLKSVSVGQNIWNGLGEFKVHCHFVSPSSSLIKILKNAYTMMPIFKHLIFHTDFFVNLLMFNLSLQILVNQKLKDWNLLTQFTKEAKESQKWMKLV